MTEKRSVTVAAFFDGRAGHEKQTRGILDRLGERVALEIIPISTPRKSWAGQIVDLLRLLRGGGVFPEDLRRCQVLLGTGTPTHFPMLQAKKRFDVPAVICMSPLPILRRSFDLVLVPRHDAVPEGSNIFSTSGPPNPNRDEKRHDENRVLILCGGVDDKHHSWDQERIVGDIERLVRADGRRRHILSTSPRTPGQTAVLLEKLAARLDNLEYHDFRDTPPGWVEQEYARAAEVWVTADSVSMVYEALSSGCRVGIIPVKWRRSDNKFKKGLESLRQSGLLVELNAYLAEGARWQAEGEFDEAARCADEILKRFIWKR